MPDFTNFYATGGGGGNNYNILYIFLYLWQGAMNYDSEFVSIKMGINFAVFVKILES